MALETFSESFPDRFFNVGVSEQNMMGVATGLAEAGFIPFVYSIVPFAVLRPYEFIRNGPMDHALPVRIIGIGGGFDYGTNGISHYGLEDIGILRILPGMNIVAPADHLQACEALKSTWNLPMPVYYRLGKDEVNTIAGLDGRFEFAIPQLIGKGTDILIVSIGNVTNEAAEALKILEGRGVQGTLMVVSHIHDSMRDNLADVLKMFCLAITVEGHFVNGGLGSLISEVVAENGLPCKVLRCGVRTFPNGLSGSQSCMHTLNGISGRQIAEKGLELLGKMPGE